MGGLLPQKGNKTLPQVKEFKYVRILFMGWGGIEHGWTERQIVSISVLMTRLYLSVKK